MFMKLSISCATAILSGALALGGLSVAAAQGDANKAAPEANKAAEANTSKAPGQANNAARERREREVTANLNRAQLQLATVAQVAPAAGPPPAQQPAANQTPTAP